MTGHPSNRSKMGRPPSPRNKVRGNRIVTFITDKQMTRLKNIADNEGRSLSATCYLLLKKHLD